MEKEREMESFSFLMIKCLLRGKSIHYTPDGSMLRAATKGLYNVYLYIMYIYISHGKLEIQKTKGSIDIHIFLFLFCLSRFIYSVWIVCFCLTFLDSSSPSAYIFHLSIHIGRTRFAGSSTIDRFHAERDVLGG